MKSEVTQNLLLNIDSKNIKQKDVFNISYRINEIEKLTKQLDVLVQKIRSIRRLVSDKIEPKEKSLGISYSELVKALDINFTNNYKKETRLSFITKEIIGVIIMEVDSRFASIDKDYYINKYVDTSVQQDIENEKDLMLKMMFGEKADLFKDLDFREMNSADPSEFFRKHAEKFAGFKNIFSEKEEKETVLPNINLAYKKLAKKIHPDLEPNTEILLEKEELLKKLTLAKDNNDYLAIYEVTQTMTEKKWIDETDVEDLFNEKQLKEFSISLLTKMEDLKMEIYRRKQDPFYKNYFASSDKKINQKIENEIDKIDTENRDVLEAIKWIKTKKGFKEYIQFQRDRIEEEEQEEEFNFSDVFKM
jgi:hypothetical protein